MPVIQKPRETGIPVVDVLYSAEPDISPVPLAPAIAREKYLRAALEALPNLSAKDYVRGNLVRQYVNRLIQKLPQRHLDMVRDVHVALPEEIPKYSRVKRDYIPSGIHLSSGDIVLVKGRSGIYTPIHELGHATEDLVPDFLMDKIRRFYKENPDIIGILEREVRKGKYNPAEIYADLYGARMIKEALPQHPVVIYFNKYLPHELRGIPDRLYRIPSFVIESPVGW